MTQVCLILPKTLELSKISCYFYKFIPKYVRPSNIPLAVRRISLFQNITVRKHNITCRMANITAYFLSRKYAKFPFVLPFFIELTLNYLRNFSVMLNYPKRMCLFCSKTWNFIGMLFFLKRYWQIQSIWYNICVSIINIICGSTAKILRRTKVDGSDDGNCRSMNTI